MYSFSLLPLALTAVYSAALRAYERMELLLWVNLGTAVLQTGAAFILLRQGGRLVPLILLLLAVQLVGAALAAGLCHHFFARIHL